MKSGFVPTDPDLMKSLFPGDGGKISSHLLRRIESSYLFGLNEDVPGPAKEAPQTTSHTISSGNPSIIKSRTESIIFSLLSGTNNSFYLLGQFQGIDH
jgi:hypothetical protein